MIFGEFVHGTVTEDVPDDERFHHDEANAHESRCAGDCDEVCMEGINGTMWQVISKSTLKALKLMRFLKLSRLIKGSSILSRIDPDTVDQIEDFLADGLTRTVLRMLRIVLLMGLVCHYMACGWTLAG